MPCHAIQNIRAVSSVERNTYTIRHMRFHPAAILFLSTTHAFGIVPRSHMSTVTTTTRLFGILDEVRGDNFILGQNTDDGDDSNISRQMEMAYETFLAELVFSPNDPRLDIIENFERTSDPEWLGWLDTKIKTSTDPEEKIALKDLREMISDIMQKMELSKMAEERAEKDKATKEAARLAEAEAAAVEGRTLSDSDLLKRANKVNTAGIEQELAEMESTKEKVSFLNSELTPEIRLSYEALVKQLLPPYQPGENVNSVVYVNYEKFDAQLVKVLTELADSGDEGAKGVLSALGDEQQKRLADATERLKQVLSAGEPGRMEGVIVKLARDGRIDEPFLLLLEANANQAKAAGATGPAQLMMRLKQKAVEEKDRRTTSKEVKLLRKLLRLESTDERQKLLEDAFTPRENILVEGSMENARRAADGEAPEQEKPVPDIPPPDFINCCKAVLLNFGNLGVDTEIDRFDLSEKIKEIAGEAEIVATRIYGKGMTAREQQDRAWAETTTSIFDLERMELDAESRGEHAPWSNPDADDDIIPGFDASGRMQIGGK